MVQIEINRIPSEILNRYKTDRIALLTTGDLGQKVLGTTNLDLQVFFEVEGLMKLVELREQECVYSITLTIFKLNEDFIQQAAVGFGQGTVIVRELIELIRKRHNVYVAYTVTHFNYKPLDELTVFIGGDCYRTDPEINDLYAVLNRTKDLAQAMIRKAVMIFPDISALHGGKKGEWIILDEDGRKIEQISEEVIVALGTLVLPTGIKFLNDYKEQRAIARGFFSVFPAINVVRPDTISPDVLSGLNWKIMCDVWTKRGVDLSYVTCLPESLGGPIVPSSVPTGRGLVATVHKLIEYYFHDANLKNRTFLLEAAGGVGKATIESLIARGSDPARITVFDKSQEACSEVQKKYHVKAFRARHSEFYTALDKQGHYDVWINNGEGDNTRPEYIEKLLQNGVRIFCGAANNLLKLKDEGDPSHSSLKEKSLQMIFDVGAWVWPDEAVSGGGWTLAALDLITRSKRQKSNSDEVSKQISDTIISRNERLVENVIGELQKSGAVRGEAIWRRVKQLIDERVIKALSQQFSPEEILKQANVTTWELG